MLCEKCHENEVSYIISISSGNLIKELQICEECASYKTDNKILGSVKDVAKVDFEYSINYEPNLAEISLKGFVIIMGDSKEIKDIVSGWKKKKEVLAETKLRIFNTIFHKCNIKALELEEDFNLPPHLRLPFISPDKSAPYTG